ncbi:PepSY domain-containing protein [Paenibacillus timonensis]|uniref:PepSY domain-containing protein n=1 Tax=Paenibacillus timonensis TaxID=225915 RepID=A0ABW3SIG2_9BACL|nr:MULTISPECIES: PepSY domain-containing protein [Bacillales]MCH1643128.1 PepSY domain-containing protein [Paenibacillus timonensis]
MKKKFIVPALAAAIIGGGIAGTALNTSVFAASADSSNSKVEVTDQQEQQQLAKEATITKEEAISAALKEVAGKAAKTELEDEDGTIVYGVEVTDDQGKNHDVKVDAKTGKVLKVEADDENEKANKEEKEDKDSEVSDKQEQQQLEKEAKISAEESKTIALKEVNGQVTDTELEDEDGTVVYGVEITDAQGKKHDVKVDAKTGKVLKVDVDDENDSESNSEQE